MLAAELPMSGWSKFFLVRLPLAILVVAAVAQAMAWMLAGVTLHRHNVDDLANAVMYDERPYRVVLLGDSVTHNVAHKYRIGDPDEVADLTTHAFAGLPSSLFLLKRYLEKGHRPQHAVLAVSRGVFTIPLDKGMFNYYIGSVFKLPYERSFLAKNYYSYLTHGWRPAALSVTTSIGEPLFSLIRRPGNDIWRAPETPLANPSLEQFLNDPDDAAVFQNYLDASATIRPESREVIEEMCRLSQQYGFSLHLVWAPVETRLLNALKANGTVQSINRQLAEIFKQSHTQVAVDDTDDQREYLYFDSGLMHIRGLGWEQTYANQLTAYIHHFEGDKGATATARN
jgi:hypothetical protein